EHPELFGGPNAVVSSASIGTAFAMLRAGATGETAAQIDDVLGFPSSGLGPAYNFLTEQWTTPRDDGPELSVANELFFQEGLAFKAAFLDVLGRDFGVGVQTVDFAGDAAEVLNAWVREQTRERIQGLCDQLSPSTRLVLANAIYLKATWVSRFTAEATWDAAFRRSTGEPVHAPFMHQTSDFDFVREDGWSAIRLPYRGGELSMWVLLPDDIADPVALLDPAVLARATASATRHDVELSLPKWDFQCDATLTDVLPAMGMPKAFSPAAEFGGIADTALMIDDVIHRADITVDEEGTEAAAVTAIIMRVAMAISSADAVFDADRPFAFAVLHDATGSPLFEGVVGNPTSESTSRGS
ncbi:MAG TPA: serpin family protein, partial [Nocardioidaceae bacterium]|nr:serpin family protein [Nocardioidaceae bacterium]